MSSSSRCKVTDVHGQVFRFTRTANQVAELRELSRLWCEGEERFWAFDDVLAALGRSGSLGFFAAETLTGPWQGMLLADVGPFTTDLLYVYVKHAWRRRGIGAALLQALTAELQSRAQIEALFLEVRASNKGAQDLYRSLNMAEIGRRRAYYADGEDALVFRLEFSREPT